jgi:hypothetical protein
MDEEQIPAPAAPAVLPAAPVNNSVKLPAFWPANIAAWFSSVEGIFELRGITSQRAQYFNVLAALPESTVVLIADLVETSPLPADPFDQLKGRLVTAHQLTDIQRVEKLLALPPLGKQKPSELLAEMVRICPRGEENSVFFNCHFLQKLPRELRILLSETDMSDKRQLSAKADQIWAHNAQLHHDTVAAIAPEPEVPDASVVAVQGGRFNRGGRGVQRGSGLGRGRGRGRGAAAGNGGGPVGGGQAGTPTPLKLARQASGLCFFHFQFGDRANSCTEPCSWQGN